MATSGAHHGDCNMCCTEGPLSMLDGFAVCEWCRRVMLAEADVEPEEIDQPGIDVNIDL